MDFTRAPASATSMLTTILGFESFHGLDGSRHPKHDAAWRMCHVLVEASSGDLPPGSNLSSRGPVLMDAITGAVTLKCRRVKCEALPEGRFKESDPRFKLRRSGRCSRVPCPLQREEFRTGGGYQQLMGSCDVAPRSPCCLMKLGSYAGFFGRGWAWGEFAGSWSDSSSAVLE